MSPVPLSFENNPAKISKRGNGSHSGRTMKNGYKFKGADYEHAKNIDCYHNMGKFKNKHSRPRQKNRQADSVQINNNHNNINKVAPHTPGKI